MRVIQARRIRAGDREITPLTIAIIGKAIRDASSYLPIRNLSADIASTAPRKDFAGQARNLWNYFNKKWRYVKDPYGTETVTVGPGAIYTLVLGKKGGVGRNGFGVGDCDDATVGFGSMLRSIGFPVRIGTTAGPGLPGIGFIHVFPMAYIPPMGWIATDPVLVPEGQIGSMAPHCRMGLWDLKGNLIATRGVSASALKRAFKMQRRK